MHFLTPHLLHLAWLALIPLALYLFRRKARRVPVSTLLFFRSLSREHRESAWLRRIKKWLSLALTLLIIWLVVLALGTPVGNTPEEPTESVMIVVDCTASMAARDAAGVDRVTEARRLVKERLARLPDQTVVSLLSYTSSPKPRLSRNTSRRECLRLLDELKPEPIEGKNDAMLGYVKWSAELEPGTRVWHASDAAWTNTEGLDYEFINAALTAPLNVGITGFQVRPAPLSRDRYEAFIQVAAAAANARTVTATLEVTLAGRLVQLRELELDAGEATSLILPIEGVQSQQLQARLRMDGDSLGWDDAVAAQLPQNRPLVVAWVAENPDPFTELAMTSLIEAGRIEMLRGTPAAWPMANKPDIYVFEQWLPETWPEDRPVIALNPPRSVGPISIKPLPGAGLPHESIRAIAPDHPLLFRVVSSRVALTQTGVLASGGSLEPLWMAGSDPVLTAGEVNGKRVVATTFSPARSEQLALLPAFPLLLGNALYWCAEDHAGAGLNLMHPGSLALVQGLVQWTEWTGTQFTETSDSPTNGGLLAIKRLGAWQSADGSMGSSVLASRQETNLPAKPAKADTKAAADKPAPETAGSRFFWDWPSVLMWAVLGLLVLESFLFHRKAVF